MPTIAAVDSSSKPACEKISLDEPKKLSEVELSQAVAGLVKPGSPFEAIIREIFQTLATQEEDAIHLRSMALEAEQTWRKELLQKLGDEGVSAATKNRHNRLISKFAHAIESLPLIGSGVTALVSVIAAGTGVGLGILAGAGIAVGALMFLDTVLDDPAKKAVANLLARGDSEKTQAWMGRISLVIGIVSLACSIGLTFGAGEILPNAVHKAIITATTVSDVASQGAQAWTQRRSDLEQAVLIELENELHDSDKNLKDEYATVNSLRENIKNLFDMFEASMKSHQEASSRIFDQ
jgi:hypothetical protein